LEVELTKWSVLYIIPEDESVTWITCVVTGTNEANDASYEKHLTKLYATLEVYRKKMNGE